MKKINAFVTGLLVITCFTATAQQTTNKIKNYKVAIVAPLYLDSAFSGTFYRYAKGFPKFAAAGFDFVQGAQMAIKDFANDSTTVEVKIFDSRASVIPLADVLKTGSLNGMNLIIGSVKDQEYMLLAKHAADKKIPFVSATYPNDGGIKNDPYLVVHNSTLQSHCESIFSHLLTSYGTEKIVMVRQPDERNNMVADLFKKLNSPDKNQLLNLVTVDIGPDDFSAIDKHLDSTRSTLVLGATLDADLANGVTKYLNSVKEQYPTKIIGMPTWEGVNFSSTAFKDYEIYYTSNFYNPKNTTVSKNITNSYKQNFKGTASEMVFKAYDVTSYFLSVMKKYPADIMGHINDGTAKAFTNPIYFPDYSDASDMRPNYYENKRVYFIKKWNGTTSKIW